MSDVSGSSSAGNKKKGKGRDEEASDEDTWDSDDDDDTIARIQRTHFAQAAAMRGRRRSAPRPRPMSNKRKLEAVKQFHNFTKKLKKDTGVAIRSLVGENILELSDFLSADSKSDSDGLSEGEFVVNPNAIEELNQDDESYIDPETGDFVQSKKSVQKPPKPASPPMAPEPEPAKPEDLPEEKKTLSISDIISDGDLDLTKNVEISEVEGSELCPDAKAEELLDLKNEDNSEDFDITEKLKEMGEISVKPIKKDDEEETPPSEEEKKPETEDEILVLMIEGFGHPLIYIQFVLDQNSTEESKMASGLSLLVSLVWITKTFTLLSYLCVGCQQFSLAVADVEAACAVIQADNNCLVCVHRLSKNVLRLGSCVGAKQAMRACNLVSIGAGTPLQLLMLLGTYTVVLLQFAFL